MLQGGWYLSQQVLVLVLVVMWNKWLMRNMGCVRLNDGRCLVGGSLMCAICGSLGRLN